MKVSPLTRISSPSPCFPYRECPLHRKSIAVLPWPDGTHSRSGTVGSILQVFLGFIVSLQCESLASQIQLEAPFGQH